VLNVFGNDIYTMFVNQQVFIRRWVIQRPGNPAPNPLVYGPREEGRVYHLHQDEVFKHPRAATAFLTTTQNDGSLMRPTSFVVLTDGLNDAPVGYHTVDLLPSSIRDNRELHRLDVFINTKEKEYEVNGKTIVEFIDPFRRGKSQRELPANADGKTLKLTPTREGTQYLLKSGEDPSNPLSYTMYAPYLPPLKSEIIILNPDSVMKSRSAVAVSSTFIFNAKLIADRVIPPNKEPDTLTWVVAAAATAAALLGVRHSNKSPDFCQSCGVPK
jgi:hypothetical protein